MLQPEQQTEDLLALTESWFHLLSKQPMDMIRNISTQPFPELHCGALRIFTVSPPLRLTGTSISLHRYDHRYLLLCVCVPGYCRSALGSEVNGQHSQFHGVCFGSFHRPDKGGQRCEVRAGGIACVLIHGITDSGQPALHQSKGLFERGTLLCFSRGLGQHRRRRLTSSLKAGFLSTEFKTRAPA